MIIRGAALIFMMVSLYFNWEARDLTATPNFIMSGIFGGFSIITFGLILETGLDTNSDTCIEVSFLICGTVLNLVAVLLAFMEYYDPMTTLGSSAANKGFLALIGATMYIIDIACICC